MNNNNLTNEEDPSEDWTCGHAPIFWTSSERPCGRPGPRDERPPGERPPGERPRDERPRGARPPDERPRGERLERPERGAIGRPWTSEPRRRPDGGRPPGRERPTRRVRTARRLPRPPSTGQKRSGGTRRQIIIHILINHKLI